MLRTETLNDGDWTWWVARSAAYFWLCNLVFSTPVWLSWVRRPDGFNSAEMLYINKSKYWTPYWRWSCILNAAYIYTHVDRNGKHIYIDTTPIEVILNRKSNEFIDGEELLRACYFCSPTTANKRQEASPATVGGFVAVPACTDQTAVWALVTFIRDWFEDQRPSESSGPLFTIWSKNDLVCRYPNHYGRLEACLGLDHYRFEGCPVSLLLSFKDRSVGTRQPSNPLREQAKSANKLLQDCVFRLKRRKSKCLF